MKKLLSVAVPCYNSQDYMKKCIESLLEGGNEMEIIIVDDGSSDRTAEIADSYAEKYPNICKAIHQENGGHGEAVNTGLSNATGHFFKVVDSDDKVSKEALLKLLEQPFCASSMELAKHLPDPILFPRLPAWSSILRANNPRCPVPRTAVHIPNSCVRYVHTKLRYPSSWSFRKCPAIRWSRCLLQPGHRPPHYTRSIHPLSFRSCPST